MTPSNDIVIVNGSEMDHLDDDKTFLYDRDNHEDGWIVIDNTDVLIATDSLSEDKND